MTPKNETLRSNAMMSLLSIDGDDEGESLTCNNNAAVGSRSHPCNFEHSFSHSELDYKFNRQHSSIKSLNIDDIRSDFVHLHSIQVHPNNSTDHCHPHDECTEGFQFRSLKAITKDRSKVVVVVPSIDLDRKELRR